MLTRSLWTALLGLLASTATAQTFMTAEDFDAYATGNTIYYNRASGDYAGVEAYHPRQRVTWVADGGECQKGTWFEDTQTQQICFLYDGTSFPVCWGFYLDGGVLMAEPSPGSAPWAAFEVTSDPIPCTSPFLGS